MWQENKPSARQLRVPHLPPPFPLTPGAYTAYNNTCRPLPLPAPSPCFCSSLPTLLFLTSPRLFPVLPLRLFASLLFLLFALLPLPFILSTFIFSSHALYLSPFLPPCRSASPLSFLFASLLLSPLSLPPTLPLFLHSSLTLIRLPSLHTSHLSP